MNPQRVLVLGGSGFVGRHVCEQLARLGWHITVPTRRAVNAASVQSLPGLTVIEASVHKEADLARLMPGCAGVRRWGAASLDFAYVASGRFDGYWERELQPWDMAAGLLLVREAGGFAQAVPDGQDILDSGSVICGNDGLFDAFSKIIRNV